MTVFNYVALRNNKDIVKGKVEAANLKQARDNVRKLGFIPTKIYEEAKAATENKVEAKKVQGLNLQDKIDFTSTFQILIQSGIPVIEALVFMENDAAKLKIRLLAKEMRRQIMAGSTFARSEE